jgi:hypothetical protein
MQTYKQSSSQTGLEAWPDFEEGGDEVLEGSPQQSGRVDWGNIEGPLAVGIWECTPGKVRGTYTNLHGVKPIPLPPRLGGSTESEMIQNWSRIGGRAGSTNKPLPNHYQTTTKPPPKHNRWNRAAGGPGLARRGLGFPPETVAELPRKYFPGEVLEINGSRVAPGCRRRATAGRPAVRPSRRMFFRCHFPPLGLCRTARKFPPGASR